MKTRSAMLLLICAMTLTRPAAADEFGDMFAIMFRMMLGMMSAMSDVAGSNSNNLGWGGGNSFGLGMTALPLMSGMTGLNPWSGYGGLPLNNMSGINPWSSPWGNPFSGGYNPSTFPGYMNPYNMPNTGYPGGYGAGNPSGPYASSSLLSGRWYGNTGVILEIRGNRFRLQDRLNTINGTVHIENNIVNLIAPQTGGISQYTFARNQYQLILQDAAGQVLVFQQRPLNRGLRIF